VTVVPSAHTAAERLLWPSNIILLLVTSQLSSKRNALLMCLQMQTSLRVTSCMKA
jgi:hypothetical protein